MLNKKLPIINKINFSLFFQKNWTKFPLKHDPKKISTYSNKPVLEGTIEYKKLFMALLKTKCSILYMFVSLINNTSYITNLNSKFLFFSVSNSKLFNTLIKYRVSNTLKSSNTCMVFRGESEITQ